jgi:hypothetical protein
MNLSIILLVVVVCALGLFGVGCAANRQLRDNFEPCNTTQPGTNCDRAVIETTPDYKLGFVEFDDQGWFWDRGQLIKVEGLIRSATGVSQPATAGQQQGAQATQAQQEISPQGIIIVLFVHGWKNNAAFDNRNVQMFRGTLTELSKAEQIQSGLDNRPSRKVVGVYGGWRGLSATLEPFKELSFWERKTTAHKVGHGAMTELLAKLENLQTESNKALPPTAARTELVIVGHSFGGAAVYSAISQIVTERFVDTIEHERPLKPLGDVVILLNPAFEASRHYNLNELAVSIPRYPDSQRPVLAIFTSKGDWATHYAFPIGRFFSTLFERNRSDKPQRAANRDAVGWFAPFITHALIYSASATNATAAATHTTLNPQTRKHEPHDHEKLRESISNLHEQRKKWHPNAPTPAVYSFDDCVLKPKETFRPGDPFLVVSVDKKIMNGHDDITNPVMVNFLREFILFCQKNPLQHSDSP